MEKSKDSSVIATWERNLQLIFCEICVKEIEMGNRPTTYFNKEGWANIQKNFKERTGKLYNGKQFKNKWDLMKKEWKMWKQLKQGATGLGWDPRKKTIDAPEEWWKEKLEVQPLAKKFRLAGIDPELEEKMDMMFEGVVATGSNVCATTLEDIRDDSNNNSDDSGDSLSVVAESSRSKRTNVATVKGNTSRKRGSSTLTYQVTKLVAAVGNIGSAIPSLAPSSTTPATATARPSSLSDAIHIIDELAEIKEDPTLYMHSIRLMANEVIREMFMSIAPERRVLFLRDFFVNPVV